MIKKPLGLVLAVVSVIALVGCAQPVSAQVLMSDLPRETSPAVSQSELAQLVQGNSDFAFDLYKYLKDEDGNLFFSPFSISMALAMTYAGARGESEAQMAQTLHYLLSQEDLHAAFNALDLALASRGEGAEGADGEGFRLNIVNAIWGQVDYDFLSSFLDLLAENYGAGLRVLDYMNNPEGSRQAINQWVSDQTEGRIKDLLPEGSITPMTRLVLTNAIYFNAAWNLPFEEEDTTDGVFHLADGTQVTVPMMNQTEYFRYAEENGLIAIELPYDREELSMVILTNEDGTFAGLENSLTREAVESVIGKLENTRIALAMPKFEFESKFGLKETLVNMGMVEPFDAYKADFSGMTGVKELYISDVIHKAFISVDEAGTEAAAATGVVVGVVSMPPEPVNVTLDQPFVFMIRDVQTGAILFIGRVMNPA